MKREWKPGDVALVSAPGLPERRATWATGCPKENHPKAPHWHLADRNTYLPMTVDARPLVVIDPDQIDDLAAALNESLDFRPGSVLAEAVAAALRDTISAFANPTPPKPEEPTGLGAVVEDAEGWRWVRRSTHPARPWTADTGTFQKSLDYADIDVVRVLSEGVPAC